MSAQLIAIVVTYNRLEQLQVTMPRLLAEPCVRVVVVDNASSDGTGDWLAAQEEARIEVISMATNRGGAGGFEAGMRHAVEAHDPDWIVVMDDDARPDSGTFARFLAAPPEDCDGVASAVYYPDGRICEMNRPSLNPFWHPGLFLKTLFGGGRMGFHIPDAAYDGGARPIEVASFVGLFLSRRAMQKGGYPDGHLFLYGDDAIYTLGLSRLGLTFRFDPALRFEHDCSTFSGTARVYRPLWKVYYNYRNGLILYRQAAGPILFWLVCLIVIPKWAWNGRRYGADRGAYWRLLVRAVRDGVRGRTG